MTWRNNYINKSDSNRKAGSWKRRSHGAEQNAVHVFLPYSDHLHPAFCKRERQIGAIVLLHKKHPPVDPWWHHRADDIIKGCRSYLCCLWHTSWCSVCGVWSCSCFPRSRRTGTSGTSWSWGCTQTSCERRHMSRCPRDWSTAPLVLCLGVGDICLRWFVMYIDYKQCITSMLYRDFIVYYSTVCLRVGSRAPQGSLRRNYFKPQTSSF